MKNILSIIMLCVFQGACSTPAVVSHGSSSLLSFNDLANEITVAYEDMSTNQPAADDDGPLGTP